MTRIPLTLIFLLGLATSALAQGGYAFGIKGGATIGTQRWEGFDQDPLFAYHGIAFIESLMEEEQFGLFAQAGVHQKGSAIRNRIATNFINGQPFRPPAQEFIFTNLSVVLGAKQKKGLTDRSSWYYLLGIRGDYTLDTNLDEYTDFIERNPAFAIFPIDDPLFIREINYGLTVGGGIEFELAELFGVLLEATVNPDFSLQYQQPEIPNVTNPWNGQQGVIPQRRIRNFTFEITAGFRFLNKIEYID